MFVCNYNRKTFVVDHRQKYVEIANDCLWIEIADEHLRILQTKHLQCRHPEHLIFFSPKYNGHCNIAKVVFYTKHRVSITSCKTQIYQKILSTGWYWKKC